MFERYRFTTLATAVIAGAIAATAVAGTANAIPVNDTTLIAPGYYNGTGQPNEGFTVNTVGGVEIGLGVLLRQGPAVHPTTGSVYDVSTGYYPSTSLALWNVQLSVNLRAPGNTGLFLAGITPILSVSDSNNSFTPASFNLFGLNDNAGWDGAVNVVGQPTAANYLTDYGFQNSLNPGYVPGFNPLANDTYYLTLSVYSGSSDNLGNPTGALIGSVSEQINATPLPSTWLMLLSGFVGLGFFAYRGSKKRSAAFAAA